MSLIVTRGFGVSGIVYKYPIVGIVETIEIYGTVNNIVKLTGIINET